MKKILNKNNKNAPREFVTVREGAVLSGWLLLLLYFGFFIFFLPLLLLFFLFPRFTVVIFCICLGIFCIVLFKYFRNKHNIVKVEESQLIYSEPPDDLRPIEIGYLYDYIANTNELVAIMLYFVYSGYIEIQIIKSKYGLDSGKYNVKLIQKDRSNLREYERIFLDKAFEDSDIMSWKGVLKKVGKTWYMKNNKGQVLYLIYFGIKQELQKRGYLYFYDGFENDSYDTAIKKMADNTVQKFTRRNDLSELDLPDFVRDAPAYVTNEGQVMWTKIAGFKNYIRT